MKRALITGVAGQDGSYMAELLLTKGYEVFGCMREGAEARFVPAQVEVLFGDLADADALRAAAATSVPDEVYNFGGISDLKTAYADPERTRQVNYASVVALVEACLAVNPNMRFLQASSSETLLPSHEPLHEDSPRDWSTTNPYAQAKMLVDRDVIARTREDRGTFACSALFFSHVSPRRGEDVAVLQKIAHAFAEIERGTRACFLVGNVETYRDWGFAGEYVEAAWKMLQHDTPEDFVIATGKLHSVREAIDHAAHMIGRMLTWHGEGAGTFACDAKGRKIVESVADFYKPTEHLHKVGDVSKAERALGWKPRMSLKEVMEVLGEGWR